MVEGHGVHRVAHALRSRLVGCILVATSPNGRFSDGAAAIDGRVFSRIEAIGKNLFAFFGTGGDATVVRVHFGMAGVWAIFDTAGGKLVPEPKATTRLRLEGEGVVSHLSAMSVDFGGLGLFDRYRAELGQDPLRDDVDVERLWAKVSASKRSIGQLLMDQAFFAGPGNIYRAEILFVAGVHPEAAGDELSREQFDRIWGATVRLLRVGFSKGSIVTVEPAEALQLGKPSLRRFIYNRATCGRCDGRVLSWEMGARTCFVCPACQPRAGKGAAAPPKGALEGKVFNSHCAPEPVRVRLQQGGFGALTLKELRALLVSLGPEAAQGAGAEKKAALVARLEALRAAGAVDGAGAPALGFTGALEAAAEKARAGENRAVEHIAELAPEQARAALGEPPKTAAKSARTAPRARTPSTAEALGAAGGSSLSAAFPQRKRRAAASAAASDGGK